MRIRTSLVAFSAIFTTAPAWAQEAACDGSVAAYEVRYAGDDHFEVTGRFAEPQSRWDLAHWTPPGRPMGQAQSVVDLRALAADGSEIATSYTGDGGFETEGGRGATSIVYRLKADHDATDWNIDAPGKDEVGTHFGDSYVFAGHAFFLLDWEMKRCAVDIEFALPDGWVVTAPWPGEGRNYTVADSWGLGQNMFAMGRERPETVEAGGLTLNWLMDPQLEPVSPGIRSILSALPSEYTALWGEAPGSRYAVFFMSDYMSDGGAFWNSFAMRLATPLSTADEVNWRHTLGHEVMHLWNGLGKKDGSNVASLEWVNEGWTDYLTVRTMSRAGLMSTEMLEQRIANIIRRHLIAQRFLSDVSLREAGENKRENWHRVYGSGGLSAMLLDASLSRQDPDAMATLLQALRAEQGDGYDYDRFLAALDRHSGGQGAEIVKWVDTPKTTAEIVRRFAELGIDVAIFGTDEVYVRFAPCDEGRCAPAFLAG